MADIVTAQKRIQLILKNLDNVEVTLKKARNWGIYDILNGSTFSSFIKHKRISKAERNLKIIKKEIHILENELSDLNLNIASQINTSSLNKFLDIFSDNIFSDLFTQSNINTALKNIQNLKSNLILISKTLNHKK